MSVETLSAVNPKRSTPKRQILSVRKSSARPGNKWQLRALMSSLQFGTPSVNGRLCRDLGYRVDSFRMSPLKISTRILLSIGTSYRLIDNWTPDLALNTSYLLQLYRIDSSPIFTLEPRLKDRSLVAKAGNQAEKPWGFWSWQLPFLPISWFFQHSWPVLFLSIPFAI